MRFSTVPALFVLLLSLPSAATWAEPGGSIDCDYEACESDNQLEVVTVSNLGGDGSAAGEGEEENPFVDEEVFEGATESFASAPSSFAPNMIGDFSAVSGLQLIGIIPPPPGPPAPDSVVYASSPMPSAYRYKVAEDNSPFPRCRILLDYNRFQGALRQSDSDLGGSSRTKSLNRFTVGFERAFWNKRASIQVHIPLFTSAGFASAAAPNSFAISARSVGNLQLTGKYLFFNNGIGAMSGGLAMTLPTGYNVNGVVGGDPYSIKNQAVHLMPFIGFYRSLACNRAYLQGFAQLDLDTNGNTVSYAGGTSRLQDQNLFYLDIGSGYWLYQNACCEGRLRGLASIVEFHYTTTIQDTDSAVLTGANGTFAAGNLLNRVDIPTLTVGAHAQFSRSNGRVGFVFPLRSKASPFPGITSRPFNWEFVAQYNINY